MKPHHIEGLKLLFLLGLCGFVLLAHEKDAHAFEIPPETSEPAPYSTIFTNENWLILPHPAVASFSVDANGNASGFTENGIPFVQYTIFHDNTVRIQRFEIQEHHHYIINGLAVYTESELSTTLAEAQGQHA